MNPKDKDGTRLLKAKVRAKQETQIFNEVKGSKKTMKLKYKGHFNLRASGIDLEELELRRWLLQVEISI